MQDSIEDVQEKLGAGVGFGRRYPVGAKTDDPRAYGVHYFLVDEGISYSACITFGENRFIVEILIVLAAEPKEPSSDLEKDW